MALYIRVSTEEQAENPEGSIKNQEQRLREAVAYRNARSNFGEITGVYIDAGISAKDMNRPELMEMLPAVAKSFRKVIKTMDQDMKKAMVQKFIKKVEVSVDSIKIDWIIDKQHYEQEFASADKTKPSEVTSEGSYFSKSKSSLSLTLGGRVTEVDEPVLYLKNQLNLSEPILCVELDAYPEAKLLNPINLKQLVKKYGSHCDVAQLIGASEAFVRQSSKKH
ncbi:MAG: recombinase family protein [Bdellovibrio sp.]|nr:recombinase family protein [Bdellovibrio sp.]